MQTFYDGAILIQLQHKTVAFGAGSGMKATGSMSGTSSQPMKKRRIDSDVLGKK